MEQDFPWRVLDAPDEGAAAPPETRAAGVLLPGTRHAVAVAVLGIAALLAAAVAAFLVLSGPRPGPLEIDGAVADVAGINAATGSSAPDAALVAGPGLVVDVAGRSCTRGCTTSPPGRGSLTPSLRPVDSGRGWTRPRRRRSTSRHR